ncbi:MAG TPA: tetratricopeptide repeat protein [Terriglobia bacterium]|nr:tetratricopeptide repeat protein [Terriglobia bacterium]
MDRFTRRELKHDELQSVYQEFEQFTRTHYREILGVAGAVIVTVGLVVGLKIYMDRQEAAANTALGTALKTFRAYVGALSTSAGFDSQTFPSAETKYKTALAQFTEITRNYPHQKAADIARYHLGLCQSALGDHATAVKTLEQASHVSDHTVASLAKLSLAGEYASTGKTADAEKLYQDLADHPTLAVPKATALMALANLERSTNPAKSRQIYEGLEKEFASDTSLASLLKEQISELPK